MMEALKGTVVIEKQPMMEGSRMIMILTPMSSQQAKVTTMQTAKTPATSARTAANQPAKPKEEKVEKVKESANA
jgi:hypothetical protein